MILTLETQESADSGSMGSSGGEGRRRGPGQDIAPRKVCHALSKLPPKLQEILLPVQMFRRPPPPKLTASTTPRGWTCANCNSLIHTLISQEDFNMHNNLKDCHLFNSPVTNSQHVLHPSPPQVTSLGRWRDDAKITSILQPMNLTYLGCFFPLHRLPVNLLVQPLPKTLL